VLGVDSNGAVAVWERRGEGWSSGRLIDQVQDVGRVHSACFLSVGSDIRNQTRSNKHLVMLCGYDRACVFDVLSLSKIVVNFCALSLQVTVAKVLIVMVT
jgi:hypothetical protein